MAVLIVALLAAALVEGHSGSVELRPSGNAAAVRTLRLRPLLSRDARVVRDRAHDLRFSLPGGWYRGQEGLTPNLRPAGGSIVAVGTFLPRARPARACGWWPDMPQLPILPRHALLHVGEQLDAQPGTKPARPRRFRLLEQVGRPGVDEPVRSVFPWRCLNRTGIAGFYESFRAHGRLMHVTAIAGERTSRRRRRELLGVAESLRFGPTPPVPVRVAPVTGRPRTRFRLELESTHPTGRVGRHVREYWAAVRGPLKTACVIENEAWFSYGPPGATLHATLDPRRTKGNRWCRGRFRGIVRYRDGVCGRRDSRCARVHIRRAGRFAFTVR